MSSLKAAGTERSLKVGGSGKPTSLGVNIFRHPRLCDSTQSRQDVMRRNNFCNGLKVNKTCWADTDIQPYNTQRHCALQCSQHALFVLSATARTAWTKTHSTVGNTQMLVQIQLSIWSHLSNHNGPPVTDNTMGTVTYYLKNHPYMINFKPANTLVSFSVSKYFEFLSQQPLLQVDACGVILKWKMCPQAGHWWLHVQNNRPDCHTVLCLNTCCCQIRYLMSVRI